MWKDKYDNIERQLFESRKTMKDLEKALSALEAMKADLPN
jgi:hypothetical protein